MTRPAAPEKHALLVQALQSEGALPAIVYAGTRAGAEEVADRLTDELGEQALPYHAGLDRERRAAVQRRFLRDDVRMVVATNAFGMGIDKPNVRTVVHASVPASLEAYYQEAGRAGRDGAPARALLLAENRDKALHVHFIRRDELGSELPARLAAGLERAVDHDGSLPGLSERRYELDAHQLAASVGCSLDQLRALTGHLHRAGVVEPAPAPPERVAGAVVGQLAGRAEALCRASIAEAARVRWRQYREIWAYVEGSGCRRRAILRHFGDSAEPSPSGPCCDGCGAAELVPELPPPDPGSVATLDEAILSVARGARPAVGRTTCAEILHGARTKKIARNSYDGLPAYGTSSGMRRSDILGRIDELIEERRLLTTDGPYPVLRPAPAIAAA